ncbi:glycine cleavage system aminomethyltransferase GcvT [Chromohalobacter israelensis]|uniref:glycine cleavage system aminomethyltransferase GcvT n=1 Tax=Chromohalobacter israelensis TaxID=141390 RepID=UPI001CC54395|nr:glycine cleavage system aminomethyltransferase GcvT [Chromohalobacter salexigens]MBZ5877605.1 glycine cleavage system aminomethyltransferase GcvT [Chromohalobacter salexigens]
MDDDLHQTPLHDLHLSLGAKMVPFAGYSMPVQYALGVKKEHEHTRNACGLFDVSHMGQLLISGPTPAQAIETLVPADIVGLPAGMQRYALFTGNEGGILDDLMIVNRGDDLYVVVNAACKDQDVTHLRTGLDAAHQVEVLDRSLLALQGPQAKDVMARLCPEACDLVFMRHGQFDALGTTLWISRSGYTGEDGFEISVPKDAAETLARWLVEQPEVEPIGLGARDSLRLEAGLCLYGHDLDTHTTPAEASLIWAVGKVRRIGGEREGGFPGADVILPQIDTKRIVRKRVGLVGEGRAPVREGTRLYDDADRHVGQVTSGSFGPTLGKPVAMAYVDVEWAGLETTLYADVRGKRLPMRVTRMPFVPANYYRG